MLHSDSFFVFAGVDGRFVVRDIFLDGNTFHSSHSVSKEPMVADLKMGFAATGGDFRFGDTDVHRTEEFKNQGSPQQFGSLHLGCVL